MSDISGADAGQLIRRFFEAQPQWLEGQVKYVRIPGADEPQPCLSPEAGKAFLRWVGAWGDANMHAAAERCVEQIEAWERECRGDNPVPPA
jgi:hypothetical protein